MTTHDAVPPHSEPRAVPSRREPRAAGDTSVASLLDLPHHDGSAMYVSPGRGPDGQHLLGDTARVRVRVPRVAGVRSVFVRQVRDGEPRIEPARILDPATAGLAWAEYEDIYEADVLVHNPTTAYRFLLDIPDSPSGYAWLNGSGVHWREVGDTHDFRIITAPTPPTWLSQGTVYQVFPDRFARSSQADERPLPQWAVPTEWDQQPVPNGPLVGRQFYGGDLQGIIDHLDHLDSLGVRTLYLTPVFPGRSNHRYDASTFDYIDPLLGGDEDYAALAQAVHERGMRLMGDITTNHTGAGHSWFQKALAEPGSAEHGMYMWADAVADNAVGAGGSAPVSQDGSDIDPRTDLAYVSWLGHASLPKLDWGSDEVKRRMVDAEDSAIIRWMQPPYLLDGWRVDVANMTGRYGAQDEALAVARRIRARMAEVNPDSAVIGEHFFDYTSDLPGDGWHSAMNYSGFSRPVWGWLADPASGLDFVSVPLPRRPLPGRAMGETMRDFAARVPWQVAQVQLNNLGSHDTARLRNAVALRHEDGRYRGSQLAGVELAAALLFTYPGVPMLYAGDEVGLRGDNGEHGRVTMAWDQAQAGCGDRWDRDTLAIFQALSRLRASSPALQAGGIRWVAMEDDALVYLRESPQESVLVCVARASWPGVVLPRWLLGDCEPLVLYAGQQLGLPSLDIQSRTDDAASWAVLSGSGPAVGIWRLR